MSKIFRLMTKNDTSFLEGVSSKSLLDKAADICSHELFDTRVLSRDMLKLNDDLSDAFSEMYSALDERRVCFLDGMAVRVTQTCDCLRPNDAFDIRQSTKKKKKKNNKKRKNRNKGNNAGDEATETATTEKDDVAEVTKMLQQLLVSADAQVEANNYRRFERTNHIAITAPALAKVRETCATTLVLTKFMVSTALMGVSVGKPSQVREILDLLEKRLLAMRFHKAKALNYRALVQIYSLTRHNLGMGHASSSDTLRIFEWYLTDALTDYEALKKLDVLDGQPFYLELTIPACQDTSDFERSIEPLIGVACFGDGVKRVVYGGTKEAVASTRVLVVKLAEVAGVKLSESDSRYCVPTIRIGKFTFSTDGIIQDTAA
ncbi:hypothetical protein PInf_023603 [Phytophthora infestans]|nr:hypothetical protein PInf_023603 [Phytophthora infestans]